MTTNDDDDVSLRWTCPHCVDGHSDPRTRPWSVWVAGGRDADGQPTHLVCAPADASHVAESDADWLRALIRSYRSLSGLPTGDDNDVAIGEYVRRAVNRHDCQLPSDGLPTELWRCVCGEVWRVGSDLGWRRTSWVYRFRYRRAGRIA